MSDGAKSAPVRWNVPTIDGKPPGGQFTAGALQDLQKQAYQEAFERGKQEGLAAGAQDLNERAERFDQLLNALSEPLGALDETVERQLVDLAMTVARQLIRRELNTEPDHVIGVVREAVGMLPIANRDVRVHLHPDDAALVRESLSAAEGERAWSIVEDPLIRRGGCSVAAENSRVDAQIESRLEQLIATITGDERQ